MMEDDFVLETCRPGTSECCRYLTMAPGGWRCAKLTSNAAYIDAKVTAGEWKARGDNCPGR